MLRRSGAVLKLVGGMAAVCSLLLAQSKKIEDLATGKVLVMERAAPDPNFTESVILLIHYGKDGVVGLMLNQAAGVPLSRLRDVNGTGIRSDPLYVGGPVELDTVTAVVRAPNPPPNGIPIAADLYAVQSKPGLEAAVKASKGSDDLRVYLGYCGWVIPQLQNEVTHGSWHIFDHGERFVFDSKPATLWKRLIERTELQVVFTVLPVHRPGGL